MEKMASQGAHPAADLYIRMRVCICMCVCMGEREKMASQGARSKCQTHR